MNTVNCIQLNKELEALERAPYPGELGKRILDNVSKQGWQAWLDHQTMLINENNLNMLDEKAQSYLKEQMEKFFFSADGADDIVGYTKE
ncbi:FIG001341: Probable Fe(2+)-trafficking protein YggX [Bathymodiolus thermophilus thioautotrophic gill symbiont]|jgi:Fe-S cluster biosynthesis and repair protein YggX|uniref:Probable Fe(2+)-trafficking protein n=1 Tax=Bathymodiolus thermophilus thioautotrophic gill symbiont TaxID=2360 RepID=A0A1J5TYT4_9GAMM|nr:oxidative damage protection protein [Bathymodiolus thermophilus thioautotrophic gill symbiont]AYQ56723.1 iron transporter [Bathymodiolus thermophilus thioautotrophic gill symbiont]OIR25356.1 oxidative damage protection protein [Bathymodiolus thermophilus thioautotrophic gill symbiont]CAB5495888.1 FIG001341: Probable Fe(2+)-trafficking protein YggX [Bathymodiolus thermophilus thioautotrophic gill symbiont]CAB5502720.1 FIG001341: Probable Fe(2+)-trafficking protein YggX [Bathymodiolus thermoph